ncbi:MAG TPA: hypothetical protein VF545_12810, partial [Thermoleophilaceae bacterium]
ADAPVETGIVPCIIDPDNCPRPVDPGSPEGQQVVDYLNRCCGEEFLQASFESRGMTVGPAAALTVTLGEPVDEGAAAADAAPGPPVPQPD